MTLHRAFVHVRLPMVLLVGCHFLGGCASETSPTALAPAPIAPVARMDMDSLCQTARTMDSSDRAGTQAGAQVLQSCLERIQGAWVLDSAALPNLELALDSAVASYPDAWRASARDRLRAVARIPRQLSFLVSWPRVAMGSDGQLGVSSRPDGVGAPFEDAGEEIWLSTKWEANRLVQVFQASDGLREDAYSLSADGRRLLLVAKTSGDGMPRPLVIPMAFRRP